MRNFQREGGNVARLYKVSADVNEKEKAIGGVLTFAQGGWLALGLLLGAGLFLLLRLVMPLILALILGVVPFVVLGGVFAFYTKGGLPFPTYLVYKKRFKKKTPKLINDNTYGKKFEKADELFQ